MNRRERLERKAERRLEWAARRQEQAAAAQQRANEMQDMIPVGQPILVGHHSEGPHRRLIARIETARRRGFEHMDMAHHHATAASGIHHQLERSIYSDDANAVEALSQRIATLEAERERVKQYNASVRKGKPDRSLLTESDIKGLEMCIHARQSKAGEFPSYHLSGISGNIKRNRDRLAALENSR